MTSLIEQTEVDILKMFEKFVKTDASPLMLRAKLHALLTQYTEEVVSPMEDMTSETEALKAFSSVKKYVSIKHRNLLRKEQFQRAGLSHGEKET